jgi:hypothetical protein
MTPTLPIDFASLRVVSRTAAGALHSANVDLAAYRVVDDAVYDASVASLSLRGDARSPSIRSALASCPSSASWLSFDTALLRTAEGGQQPLGEISIMVYPRAARLAS